MPTLKTCPFCGSKVKIEINGGSYGYIPTHVFIKCCCAHMVEDTEKWTRQRGHFNVEKEARQKLAERWNTRSVPCQK